MSCHEWGLWKGVEVRTESRIELTLREAGGPGQMRRLPRLVCVRWREPW